MRFRRALVTGGAGFIGSHLVERLVAEGLQVAVLDNLSTGKRENVPPSAELIVGDVQDSEIVARAVRGADAIFHLAARVSIRASVEGFYEDAQTNVMGALSVLRHCGSSGVLKFIFASSMAVYADSSLPQPLPESYATIPISPYGVSKLACERYAQLVGHQAGFETISLRLFNTYGPRQTFTPYVGVITIFIQRLLRGEAPEVFGDGEQCRDFVYVGDVVEGMYRALVRDVGDETFNIGSGQGVTVNEIASLLCSKLRPGLQPLHAPAHAGELHNSIADIRQARRLLGFEPRARLEERINEVIGWNRRSV